MIQDKKAKMRRRINTSLAASSDVAKIRRLEQAGLLKKERKFFVLISGKEKEVTCTEARFCLKNGFKVWVVK